MIRSNSLSAAFAKDSREQMANALLARGTATMKEIMTVAYGEWPLRGLDIDPAVLESKTVSLKNINEPLSGHADLSAHGLVINKAMLDPYHVLHATMGHEGLHVLQYYNYGSKAGAIMSIEVNNRANTHIQGPSANKTLRKLLSHEREQYNNASPSAKEYVKKYYLNVGIEIQSRLHVIMSEGYQDWRSMPKNKDDFWMALMASGLKLPQDIVKRLESLPQDSSACRFKHSRGYAPSIKEDQAINEINMFISTLSQAGQDAFWRNIMPAIYANMLELYGDRQGRKRFGLDTSAAPRIKKQPPSL
jgi:hypothetical protein